jgi:transcriptional regulator with XRE-family HTH domain
MASTAVSAGLFTGVAADGAIKARFGKRVRQLRLARGWSQERLAERADISTPYLSGVERGHRNPTLVKLVKIARALDCGVGELFVEHETTD